jgi:hypothetical protein
MAAGRLILPLELRLTIILTCGLERAEVKRECKTEYNEELSDLCCSLHIFRVKKSRKMRWMEHVSLMGG